METENPNFDVKPPKRERSEAQKQATLKAFEALKAKREAMKTKQEAVPEVAQTKLKKAQILAKEAAKKVEAAPSAPPVAASSTPFDSDEFCDKFLTKLMSRIPADSAVPAAKPVKEKKKKVVVVEESSSDEDEETEIVYTKKPKAKKVSPIPKEPLAAAPAAPAFKSSGSYIFDKLLYGKF